MSNNKEFKYRNFYDYILKVLTISKIGLLFSKDPYAIENYTELKNISLKMLENFESINFEGHELFERNVYPTPNVSVRTLVYNEHNEICFVEESDTKLFSLPGGWCEVNDSVLETCKNETLQEAGLYIKDIELIGLIYRDPIVGLKTENYNNVGEEMVVFKAKLDKETSNHTHETILHRWVKREEIKNLPLSLKTNSKELDKILRAIDEKKVIFD